MSSRRAHGHECELIPMKNSRGYVAVSCACGWTGPCYRESDRASILNAFEHHVHMETTTRQICDDCGSSDVVRQNQGQWYRCKRCGNRFTIELAKTYVTCVSCGEETDNAEQQTRYVRDRKNPSSIVREPAWVCKACIEDGVNLAFPAGRRPPTDVEFDDARQRLMALKDRLS